MKAKTIEELIADYCAGALSAKEAARLHRYLRENPEAERMFRDAREVHSVLRSAKVAGGMDVREAERRFRALLARRSRRARAIRWLGGGMAAAAVIVAVLMMARPDSSLRQEPVVEMAGLSRIAPGEVKATLSDESGRAVEITSESVSRLVTPDGTVLVNDSLGGLRYDRSGTADEVARTQTLTVPVGGEYRFTLADGSQVWVNSASEVRFPTRFTGDSREIYMSGEIYIEVARDEARPFIVHAGDKSVRVLGTKFNLTAYPDENEVVTTLVEGSVEFCDGDKCVPVRPGEQVVLDETTGRMETREVDVSLYTSWASGTFEYEQMELEAIARQLTRWYDVRFEFDAPEFRDHPFTGVVKRNQTLDEVLRLIEKTTNVSFEIVDRTVHVKRTEDAGTISRP